MRPRHYVLFSCTLVTRKNVDARWNNFCAQFSVSKIFIVFIATECNYPLEGCCLSSIILEKWRKYLG